MLLNDIYNTCIKLIVKLGEFGNNLFLTVREFVSMRLSDLSLPDWLENALNEVVGSLGEGLFGDTTVAEFMIGCTISLVFIVGIARFIDSLNPL